MIASAPGVDQSGIRSFATETGTGYVIPQDNGVCIAIPDPVDGYGKACTSTETAGIQGVFVMLFDSTDWDRPTIALALPAGAAAQVVSRTGQLTTLSPNTEHVITTKLPPASAEVRVIGPMGTSELPLPAVPPPPPPTQGVGVVRAPHQ